MHRQHTIDVLNRLLTILCRSLPQYLANASPWAPWDQAGLRRAQRALDNIVADEKLYAAKVAEAIDARGGRLEIGEFPMVFTDTHDLALDFMLGELLHCQRQDVAAIEECVRRLSDDPPAQMLAEEVLGNARGHLQTLQELIGECRLINAG